MAVDDVVFDRQALERLLEGPEGPVARELGKLAIRVESEAKLNATGRAVQGANNPAGRGPHVRTGRLRSSIAWRMGRDNQGLYADVGTNVEYAIYLEVEGVRGGRTYPFLLPALNAI